MKERERGEWNHEEEGCYGMEMGFIFLITT